MVYVEDEMYDYNGGIYVGLWRIAPNDSDENYTGNSLRAWSGLGGIIMALVAAGLRFG